MLLRKLRERIFRMCEKLGLGTPWACYVGRVKALFEGDPDVSVSYDEEAQVLKIRVEGGDKAEAITSLMPMTMTFGNVKLDIEVVPSNSDPSEADMYRRAFAGNPAFVDVAEGYGPAHDVAYALFMPDVVQLHEDDLSEFDGLKTLTYAELAKSVLDEGDIFVSSAVLDD